MRITRIEIENIRCFEQVAVDFTADGEPAAWNLVLGDNGTGKSTLLQCIALGLASPRDTGALLQDTQARWLRQRTARGAIRIDFKDHCSTELTIEKADFGEHVTVQGDFPWHELFVCGYGAGRRALNDRSYEGYFLREAVLGLFDPEARLQNAELVLRRMGAPQQERILHQIDCLLMLPKGSIRLSHSGLEISGPWGSGAPEWSLGDGYKTTLAWVLDLVGWALLRDPKMLETGIEGIVLIDEIEQHLHPQWQRRILSLLRRLFPKVQFLATTHSSLCVLGTTDLKDEEVNLVHLRQEERKVEATSGIKPPRGQRADQILTSYLFGLETTSDDQTKAEIERLSRLLGQADFDAEDRSELYRLRERLGKKLGSGETELERRATSKIRDDLEEGLEPTRGVSRSGGLAASPPEEALDLEVKRQFQDLLRKL
jgi:hypothetical protein